MSEAPAAGDAGIRPTTLICIDGRTCGHPVRPVAAGCPVLNGASMSEKRQDFLARHDRPARSESDACDAVFCGCFYSGKAIDRSPCGTGTSARMAQLRAKRHGKTSDPYALGFQVV